MALGLCGQFTQVHHLHDERKAVVFHRGDRGGPSEDTLVVADFFRDAQEGCVIGFPSEEIRKLRFNSDWEGYNDDTGNHPSTDVVAEAGDCDGLPCHGAISIGPYSVLIFSH